MNPSHLFWVQLGKENREVETISTTSVFLAAFRQGQVKRSGIGSGTQVQCKTQCGTLAYRTATACLEDQFGERSEVDGGLDTSTAPGRPIDHISLALVLLVELY